MFEDPQHPLFGACLKIDRAGDQLKALDASIKAFFDSNPYTLESQAYTDTEILWRVVRVHRAPDPMWSAMTGEIIHNLRTESGFNHRGVPKMLQGVRPATVALIKSLQPFATQEGVQSPLWHLQEFSNRDKHRSIYLTGASMPKVNASFVVGTAGGAGLAAKHSGAHRGGDPDGHGAQ